MSKTTFKAAVAILICVICSKLVKGHSSHRTENTELYDAMGLHFSASSEEIEAQYKKFQENKTLTYRYTLFI